MGDSVCHQEVQGGCGVLDGGARVLTFTVLSKYVPPAL